MNEITRMYVKLQKESGLSVDDFIKTINNEEHKMHIQWKLFRNACK